MRGLPLGVRTIDRHFHAVPCLLQDHRVVLWHSRCDLRFGLIQLPGSDLCVAGETHSPCYQAQSKSQYTRFCFHVASIANKVWDWFTARILVPHGAFCNSPVQGIEEGRLGKTARESSAHQLVTF